MEEDRAGSAACRVRRDGRIAAIDGAAAVLRIAGRDVPVPADRLAPGLKPGDAVRWTGLLWESLEGE